jgi:hypothetical protein
MTTHHFKHRIFPGLGRFYGNSVQKLKNTIKVDLGLMPHASCNLVLLVCLMQPLPKNSGLWRRTMSVAPCRSLCDR